MKEKRTRIRRKNAGYKKLFLMLIIFLIIILMLMKVIFPATVSLSKYVYSVVRGAYLNAKDFYFTSNILDKVGKDNSVEGEDWDGIQNHSFDVVMYSKKNDYKKATADIEYKISIVAKVYQDQGGNKGAKQVGTDLEVSPDSGILGTKEEGIKIENEYIELHVDKLEGKIFKDNNQDSIKIDILPKNKEFFKENDYVEVKIVAESTKPYTDKIEGTYSVKVKRRGLSYSIEDSKNSPYMNLIITNASTGENERKNVELGFETSQIVLDTTSKEYCEAKNLTEDSEKYFNKLTIEIGPLESKSIKFYKKNIAEDYSYPNIGNNPSIITVN